MLETRDVPLSKGKYLVIHLRRDIRVFLILYLKLD